MAPISLDSNHLSKRIKLISDESADFMTESCACQDVTMPTSSQGCNVILLLTSASILRAAGVHKSGTLA